MRLNNFLLEYSNPRDKRRSVPISEEKFLELREKNCKDGAILYRGISGAGTSKYMFIDPSKSIRSSEYTLNYYMLLMEISPFWKNFPKLSKSIICANNLSGAAGWGEEFVVYPYDGAKLAITPKRHFWASFIYDMDELNRFIEYIFNLCDIKVDVNEKNPIIFKNAINKIKDDILNYENEIPIFISKNYSESVAIELMDIYNYFLNNKDIFKFFYELLPSNKFKLITTKNEIPSGTHQIWTESPCLLKRYYRGEDE